MLNVFKLYLKLSKTIFNLVSNKNSFNRKNNSSSKNIGT